MNRFVPLLFSLALVCALFALPTSALAHEGHAHGKIKLPSGRVLNDGHIQAAPAAFGSVPTASYVIGGPRWNKNTLRYYDTTRGEYRKGVNAAVAAWNSRGLPVKFKRTSCRSCADFIVQKDRKIASGGLATVGYWGGAGVGRYFVKLNMDGYRWWDVAWVASHELGHIYGLGHSRGCAVMSYAAYDTCRWPQNVGQPWMWRCRLQEKDDLAGVKRLYGGRFVVRNPMFCLKNPASGAVTGLTVTPGGPDAVAILSWTAAPRAKNYAIYRGPVGGSCVTNPANVNAQIGYQTGLTFTDAVNLYQPPAEGLYCYSVFSLNIDGYPNPKSRASITYTYTLPVIPAPVVAAPTITKSESVPEDYYQYKSWSLQFTTPVPAGAQSVIGTRQFGSCLDDTTQAYPITTDYFDSSYEPAAQTGARICYRFWSTGYYGNMTRYSTPTDVWVDLP